MLHSAVLATKLHSILSHLILIYAKHFATLIDHTGKMIGLHAVSFRVLVLYAVFVLTSVNAIYFAVIVSTTFT